MVLGGSWANVWDLDHLRVPLGHLGKVLGGAWDLPITYAGGDIDDIPVDPDFWLNA